MLYVTVRVLYVKVECQHFQDAGKNVVWLFLSYDLFTFQNGLEEQKLSLKQNSFFPATPIPQCAILTHRGPQMYCMHIACKKRAAMKKTKGKSRSYKGFRPGKDTLWLSMYSR